MPRFKDKKCTNVLQETWAFLNPHICELFSPCFFLLFPNLSFNVLSNPGHVPDVSQRRNRNTADTELVSMIPASVSAQDHNYN